MIHIGSKIKEIVEVKEISITQFAKNINKSRTVVYHIFDRESIDSKLLFRISQELNFNFFNLYFPVELEKSIEASEDSLDYRNSFKLKYYSILEKYNKLLEKQLRGK